MKIAALFFIAFTVALGGDNRAVGELGTGADFLAAVAVADRVQIDMPQPSSIPPKVELSKLKELEKLLAMFRFSAVPLRGQKILVNGEEAWVVTPCLCLGDYRLRFFRKDAEIVSVTFHHQQFIRVEGKKGGAEFDLIPKSGAEIREHLDALMKERANHTAEPASPSRGGSS